MSLFRAAPMTCQELVELLTEYLEGTLPKRRREALEAHLADCADCSAYLEQFRTTIALTGRLRVDDVDPTMMDALLEVFRDWKD